MEVFLAKHAGACYGVKRALELALSATRSYKSVYTLGPLIHNPKVVDELNANNVRVADDLDSVISQGGEAIIIRSHGIPLSFRKRIESQNLEVIDATCPHVARAQRAAAELAERGCYVVVIGEEGHPEVMGLTSYAKAGGAPVVVVESPEDLPDDLAEPVGVVVQTTQRYKTLEDVVEELERRGIKPIVKRTICMSTILRQKAAEDLSAQVDAMVIIGGRNSSNTTRLAEICKGICARCFHIEDVDELKKEWFRDCCKVGVSAGASTPKSQITPAVEWLFQL